MIAEHAHTFSNRPPGGTRRRPARRISGLACLALFPGLVFAGEKVSARVNSHLVLVPVTVTDRNGKSAIDLEQQHFRVTEDSEPREITSLTREDGAVGLGLVVDLSGSMKSKLGQAVSAAHAITELAGEDDEAFLLTFGDRPEMRVRLTRDTRDIVNGLNGARAHGSTALIDAVYRALHEIRASSHGRKALAILSDGGDNASRYTPGDLKRLAVETDAQIYAISIVDNNRDREQRRGAFLLEELAELTGGLHFTIRHHAELPAAAEKMARAMKDVYVIGYKPGEALPGKWRKIRVSVTPPTPQRLRVSARSGYFVPE
jgi:Ca-activated chloride channel homolog